jgi:hypothetical protein
MADAVPRGVVVQVDDRDRCLDRWTGRGIAAGRNLHHRKLRSRGGPHTVSNLITLSGSGTTGSHGYMHGNPLIATRHGFIVPAWIDDVSTVPILLADRYGRKAWALLPDDGTTTPLAEPEAERIMRDLGLWPQ